ncbi:MAG: hypothetical protein FWD48_04000 [Oscillospiraceae bacterium]|nr:hypothetical protein [Oscillospiraceae bacterium]
MIKSLLIATKENAGILNAITKELEILKPRSFIGSRWSLRSFIKSDLKNFSAETHFVFDINIISEQGTELIELLTELRGKNEKATIIIYCVNLSAGDLFLHQLIKSGFTNVIAGYDKASEAENYKLIQEDLKEAITDGLSKQKYERFLITEKPEDVIVKVEAEVESEETENPEGLIGHKSIAVFGSQKRVGATTFAMSLCRSTIERGGKAVLVLTGENAELEQSCLCKHFDGIKNDGLVTVNGIDVFAREVVTGIEEYNLAVFDCGRVQENTDKIEMMQEVDKLYLCCGIGWKDLKHVSSAHLCLQSMTYTVTVNTDDEAILKKYNNELCKNCNEVIGINFNDVIRIGEIINS